MVWKFTTTLADGLVVIAMVPSYSMEIIFHRHCPSCMFLSCLYISVHTLIRSELYACLFTLQDVAKISDRIAILISSLRQLRLRPNSLECIMFGSGWRECGRSTLAPIGSQFHHILRELPLGGNEPPSNNCRVENSHFILVPTTSNDIAYSYLFNEKLIFK